MKTLKRSVAVLLSILMLISVFSAAAMTASAADYDYYVVGTLSGITWEADANGGMTKNDDGSYTKIFDNVAAGSYEFKINSGKWANDGGEEYPAENYYLTVSANNSTVAILLTAEKNVEVDVLGPAAPAVSDYYVVGTLNGISWDATEAGLMTKNDDGSYSKTFEGVAAGSYEIKVNNGSWAENYPAENYAFTVNADNSTVVVTLSADKNVSVNVVNADPQESSVAPVADGYCLIGKINGVENVGEGENNHADVVNQFAKYADGYSLTMTITEDSYVYVKDTTCTKWYMTAGWLGNNVGTATLYETNTNMPSLPEGEFPNKLHVPAGEFTFILFENADGTLTLSYTEGDITPTPSDPSESTAPTTPSTPANPATKDVEVTVAADDVVKVTFTLQAAEKFVNGEGGLTYDSSILKLDKFEFLNVNGSLVNTELYNEVLFNFTEVQNLSDFTTAKDFVVATFKAVKAGTSKVTLNLVELNALGETDIPLVTDGNIVGEFTLTATASVVDPTAPTEPSKPTDDPKPTEPAPAPKLSVKKKLNAGETTTAKVTNAGNNKVTYTSDNKDVAKVNKNTGKITALAKGQATIKAKVGNVTVTKKIKVKNNPTLKNGKKKVTNNQTIKVNKNKTLTLKITGKAASIKNKVKTSKKNIGTITSKPKQEKVTFKAKKKGTTTLTITINKVKTYKVKVKVK